MCEREADEVSGSITCIMGSQGNDDLRNVCVTKSD